MIRPRLILRGARGQLVPAALACWLEALTSWNFGLMQTAAQRGKSFPPLYSGRFRYIREDYASEHPEDWRDAAEVLVRGGGDCEDLASYRAAELRMQGIPASVVPRLARLLGTKGRLFHIVVQRADGADEDPSRLLGMTKE